MRRVLVRQSDGLIINAIAIKDGADWTPPEGCFLLDETISKEADIGDTWDGEKIIKKPPEPDPEPPRSTYISTIDAIDITKVRPVRVKRVWEGRDYFHDCFVIETVKDQYVAGDIAVGDYVLVHYDEDIEEQIVTGKVYQSW